MTVVNNGKKISITCITWLCMYPLVIKRNNWNLLKKWMSLAQKTPINGPCSSIFNCHGWLPEVILLLIYIICIYQCPMISPYNIWRKNIVSSQQLPLDSTTNRVMLRVPFTKTILEASSFEAAGCGAVMLGWIANKSGGNNQQYMDSYGFVWIHMDLYGFIWIYMDLYGYIYIWIHMDLFGIIWIYLDSYGFFYGFIRIYGRIMAYPSIDS